MRSNRLRSQTPFSPGLRAQMGTASAIQVPRDLAPARLEPSQPGALGPERGQWVKLPGVNFAPAGATAVDEMGDSNIVAGTSATLITIRVPDTQRLRVMGIGFGADDETALGFLTWTLRIDGISQPGYTGVFAAIGSIRQLADIFQMVGSSGVMTIVAASNVLAVSTYRFICRVRGHLYTEKD